MVGARFGGMKIYFVAAALVLAALSYVWQPLLGVAVILLAVSHFVP